jgi:threonine/homoserine/homoserine lactone efflux protein
MPIRQGGMFASRASTWPRVHFLPHDDRAAPIEANDVERVLADVDAHRGNARVSAARHGCAPSAGPPPSSLLRGGGALPHHPISGPSPTLVLLFCYSQGFDATTSHPVDACMWMPVFGIHNLMIFILSGLLLNISPGPDTAYIVGRSTQLGWKAGVTAALGIGAGILVHVMAAALGISALLAASAKAFTAVKLIGATYLVYLGVKMLLAQRGGNRAKVTTGQFPVSLVVIFRQGFITNILNPKVALFFLAFLPQFIDADASSKTLAFVILGLIFDFNGTLWNVLVALVAAHTASLMRNTSLMRTWIDRAIGMLFIGIGIKRSASASFCSS